MGRNELGRWIAVGIVLAGLAIPWFLWGSSAVVAGLPLWLWWHIGWMALASVVFWQFSERAWGIGIETAATADGTHEDGPGRPDRTRDTRSGGKSP
ncbi:DUF3311 domain-containing protein [Natrinema salaciae]|uniref:DUF3311 domain-containing protein n=1 Tax=Natrinema salaciae TaxID=1186196 RepID=A0A1H9M349_9EURY|nr:DUF3311 domain-containing protein [Natrinema salaciae]SER18054.1 Protein of unknown function [Natrinema salaciae]